MQTTKRWAQRRLLLRRMSTRVPQLIVKVKEPLPAERKQLRPGQILFTYLHLAADPEQTRDLAASGAIAIAYETVTSPHGALPLLTPMSEVAGRMAPHVGARCLEKENGGRGVLLGGVPGVPPADVVILGAGVAGSHAALIAAGMGATVTIVDRNPEALRRVSSQLGTRIRTVFSTGDAIEAVCRRADLVIGSVLIPGAAAPKLISAETVKAMKSGAVIVDIAIDQGGCAATSRPTTHSAPTYVVHDVVHYCVTNMPGAVARTSTFALNNVTLPFVLALADKGVRHALGEDIWTCAMGSMSMKARSRTEPWRRPSSCHSHPRKLPCGCKRAKALHVQPRGHHVTSCAPFASSKTEITGGAPLMPSSPHLLTTFS